MWGNGKSSISVCPNPGSVGAGPAFEAADVGGADLVAALQQPFDCSRADAASGVCDQGIHQWISGVSVTRSSVGVEHAEVVVDRHGVVLHRRGDFAAVAHFADPSGGSMRS